MTRTRIIYQRDDDGVFAGTWKPLGIYGHPELHSATIVCGGCGTSGSLDRHRIAVDGEVVESVLCACGYHEHITLDGWAQYLSEVGAK